jgi:hypothetical protein
MSFAETSTGIKTFQIPAISVNLVFIEPVAKAGYFCTTLAVSQAKALRNMHF